jgi:hypothetical protein
MRVIEIAKPNAPFELVERPTPEPGPRQVRIKVEACGICHSDVFTATGTFPGVHYPAVPGHEVAGRIDAVGPEITTWKVGQRVGVGWFGGACFVCDRCRRGDFITCRNLKVPGIHYDGGYADYMIAPIDALASIPDELDATAAAPLLCAGITTFNALRNAGALAVLVPDGDVDNQLTARGFGFGTVIGGLPAAQIGRDDAQTIRDRLRRGSVRLSLELVNRVTPGAVTVNNVVADMPGQHLPIIEIIDYNGRKARAMLIPEINDPSRYGRFIIDYLDDPKEDKIRLGDVLDAMDAFGGSDAYKMLNINQ